ncbi:DUF6838 family protein [Fusobacterium sp. IOR10]|uniref:phage tail terminator family protein n=1 Tax=Fusobacterium sp. IOR10 TaxID=2665157 RepID=UPI0013D5371A|nr:hypothetical protein [Fusobacterium sp. IOR10]
MITIKNILENIHEKLTIAFPGIEIQSQDMKEGFIRPSFKFYSSDVNVKNGMKKFRETEATINIVYFPKHQEINQEELLDTLEKLNEIFQDNNMLIIKEKIYIEIEEIDSSIVDKTLYFDFDINFEEEIPVEEKEKTQELVFRRG